MYQNLSQFTIPADFRGKSGWYVQLWWIVDSLLFRPSPQIFYGWRRFLLRLFGASIGKKVIIRPSVRVTYPWKVTIGDHSWIGDQVILYSLGDIVIGSNTVISQKCYLCTGSHNFTKLTFDVTTHKIVIQNECWLATDVFIGPGVTIGQGMVVGARSSVYKSIEGTAGIYKGNPAKRVADR